MVMHPLQGLFMEINDPDFEVRSYTSEDGHAEDCLAVVTWNIGLLFQIILKAVFANDFVSINYQSMYMNEFAILYKGEIMDAFSDMREASFEDKVIYYFPDVKFVEIPKYILVRVD